MNVKVSLNVCNFSEFFHEPREKLFGNEQVFIVSCKLIRVLKIYFLHSLTFFHDGHHFPLREGSDQMVYVITMLKKDDLSF